MEETNWSAREDDQDEYFTMMINIIRSLQMNLPQAKGGIICGMKRKGEGGDTLDYFVLIPSDNYPQSIKESETTQNIFKMLTFSSDEAKDDEDFKRWASIPDKMEKKRVVLSFYAHVLQKVYDGLPQQARREIQKKGMRVISSDTGDALYEAFKHVDEMCFNGVRSLDGWFFVLLGGEDRFSISILPNISIVEDYQNYFSPTCSTTLSPSMIKNAITKCEADNPGTILYDSKIMLTPTEKPEGVLVGTYVDNSDTVPSVEEGCFENSVVQAEYIRWYLDNLASLKEKGEERTPSVKWLFNYLSKCYPEEAENIQRCNVIIPDSLGFVLTRYPLLVN